MSGWGDTSPRILLQVKGVPWSCATLPARTSLRVAALLNVLTIKGVRLITECQCEVPTEATLQVRGQTAVNAFASSFGLGRL